MSKLLTSLFLTLLLSPSITLGLPDDQYQPITIEADSAIRDEKAGTTTYKGNVSIIQGSLNLSGDEVIFVEDKATGESALIALGEPAIFQQQPSEDSAIIHAQAHSIHYHVKTQIIKLEGSARLTQGESVVSSELIEYDANSQIFKANNSESSEDDSQRVQVIIPAQTPPTEETP